MQDRSRAGHRDIGLSVRGLSRLEGDGEGLRRFAGLSIGGAARLDNASSHLPFLPTHRIPLEKRGNDLKDSGYQQPKGEHDDGNIGPSWTRLIIMLGSMIGGTLGAISGAYLFSVRRKSRWLWGGFGIASVCLMIVGMLGPMLI